MIKMIKDVFWLLVMIAVIIIILVSSYKAIQEDRTRLEIRNQEYQTACTMIGGYVAHDGQKKVCLK